MQPSRFNQAKLPKEALVRGRCNALKSCEHCPRAVQRGRPKPYVRTFPVSVRRLTHTSLGAGFLFAPITRSINDTNNRAIFVFGYFGLCAARLPACLPTGDRRDGIPWCWKNDARELHSQGTGEPHTSLWTDLTSQSAESRMLVPFSC